MTPSGGYGIDVLAFGAHPDDVELFCGGVMIRCAQLGYATGVVDLTRGELASHGSVDERAREAEAAAVVLGVRLRENLGLPDGQIEGSGSAVQLNAAVAALRRHRPEIVLLPWLEERHPDHAAGGALLTRAVFLAGLSKLETDPPGQRFVPRQVLYYEMRHRMPPSFVVDTSGAWERKVEAIRCHISQVARRPGDVETLVSSPLALDAIEARDRYHGSRIGVRYGEALRSPNTPGLIDPVAHVRANPFSEAHAFEPLR